MTGVQTCALPISPTVRHNATLAGEYASPAFFISKKLTLHTTHPNKKIKYGMVPGSGCEMSNRVRCDAVDRCDHPRPRPRQSGSDSREHVVQGYNQHLPTAT